MTVSFLKKTLLILFFFISTIKISAAPFSITDPFITTWRTNNPGVSNNNQITIPTFGGGYDYMVDWGDGTTTTNHTGDATHTYGIPGIYTVSITGNFPMILFNDKGDKDKLLTIEHWGNNEWNSMFSAFRGCSNLQGNYTDSPNLSNVISTGFMFERASSFNYKVDNWDVSNVTYMGAMFADAPKFNQDISNWNVSNVEYMAFMFKGASSFNQNISRWDVSNVTDMGAIFAGALLFNQNIGAWNVSNLSNMEFMFYQAKSFNQNIGNWNVGNVQVMEAMFAEAEVFNQDISRWNTSNVNDMGAMFYLAPSFNQDIGNWDVSKVTRMEIMFYGSASFNQNIGRWNVINVTNMIRLFGTAATFNQNLANWNVSNVTDMTKMFEGVKLSVANYDALLIGWNALNLKPNVSFDGGLSQYCLGATHRTNMLSSDRWIITDAGTAAPNINDIIDQKASGNYILPVITGANLTGNEKYYSGTNGTGTIYKAGDIINFTDFATYPTVLYIYDSLKSGCSSEQNFQLRITSVPTCTTLSSPVSNAVNVPISTNLKWNSAPNATGYKLTVGTSLGSADLLNKLDVGNVLSYDLPTDLPENTQIYLNIIPYNLDGEASSCAQEKFTTEKLIVLPPCTTLSSPVLNAVNVSISTNLSWNSAPNATGYKLTVETSSGSVDILNKLDVGNVLSYDLPTDLPENTQIYLNIIPYNLDGEATGCANLSFTTESLSVVEIIIPPKFFTPNNDGIHDSWVVSNSLNNPLSNIYIFDRYGKLIKQIIDFSIGWDGTYINRPLPVDDYWYLIYRKNGETLKGHFSLVR